MTAKNIKLKTFTTLVFISAGVLFSFEKMHAQKLISGGKPQKANIEIFDKATCVNLPKEFRVCKVFSEREWKFEFVIQKLKRTLYKFDTPSYAGIEFDDFYAYYGDLDKSGSPEIVISELDTVSNGLGVRYYNVHIFRDPLKIGFQKPFTVPIQEFGEKGNFIYDSKNNETQILVTYWSWFDNLDPKRGYGTYLVGKWFRYKNGLLEPVLNKPTLARRLLYSFADERNDTDKNPFIPYKWLKSKNTHRFFAEPDDDSKFLGQQTGVIEKYFEDDLKYERYISIKLDSGVTVETKLNYSVYGYEEKNSKIPITDLGLWKNKFVFPFWFSPNSIFADFRGKKVKLETFQDEYNRLYGKIWLLEK